MKKLMSLLLALTMLFALAACSKTDEKTPANGDDENKPETMTYAVEKGSAGEEVAMEKGYKYNALSAQADALMEVNSGTSDAAIIDLLMALAMTGEGTSYPNLKYTDKLTSEEYGVGCRKGSDLAAYINNVFAETYANGSMIELADTYGIKDAILEQAAPAADPAEPAADGDVAYIKEKGTLIVGMTEFEPMDYKNEAGDWIGFDADMAKIVAEKLGVQVQFVVIDWDNKLMELNSKNIDVAWNGMTLTDAVKESMECTNPYCDNAQVVVVPAE